MSEEHSSFIKTPKQLAIVMVLAFAIPITLIALLTQLVTGMRAAGHTEADDHALSPIPPLCRPHRVGNQDRRGGVRGSRQDLPRERPGRRAKVRRQGRVGGTDQE